MRSELERIATRLREMMEESNTLDIANNSLNLFWTLSAATHATEAAIRELRRVESASKEKL